MRIAYFFPWNRNDCGDVQQDILKDTMIMLKKIINVEIYGHTIPMELDN